MMLSDSKGRVEKLYFYFRTDKPKEGRGDEARAAGGEKTLTTTTTTATTARRGGAAG